MLVYYFLFLLFSKANRVYSLQNCVNLDINSPDEQKFKVESSQMDNVFYKHFTPLNKNLVKGVNEFETKIWESSGACKCVYSLVAYREESPYLLYLKTDCGHYAREHFYKKDDKTWDNVDVTEYSNSVSDLMKTVKLEGNFGLNLFNSINSKYYTTQYASTDRPYTFFSANPGYFCTNVYYKSVDLWSAKKYGDRCVAVWAYIHEGQYYMIRLLVTLANDESKIITYFYIQNKWVHVHTLEEDFGKTVYVQRPDNFMYPNYTFNSKRLPVSTPPPLEFVTQTNTKPDVPKDVELPVLETYLDLSGDYTKPAQLVFDFENKTSSDHVVSPSVYNLLFTDSRCVDNVEYKTYSPTNNTVVTKVVNGADVVWKAKNKNEKCVYALAPQKDGKPVSLYLLLNVDGQLRQAFMDNVNEEWLRSNLEDYKKKLKYLKGMATNYDFVMDLGDKKNHAQYTMNIKLNNDAHFFFLPKLGYACHAVKYKNKTIWQSENPFDKCVAAWSYESFGNSFYVRLLIQYYDDTHDLLSYLYARNEWECISSYNYSKANKTRYSKLLDFYHPEYNFNDDVMDYEFEGAGVYPPSHEASTKGLTFKNKSYPFVPKDAEYKEYLEGKYYEIPPARTGSQESKLETKTDPAEPKDSEDKSYELPQAQTNVDNTANNSNSNNTNPFNVDYQPVFKVVAQKDCMQLDISKRLDNFKYENAGVFDGRLNVVSYNPPPGKYFDLVTDGRMPLFIGFRMSHLCLGFNFYTKNGEFYLADALVKVKNEDVTLYFKKDDKLWYVVNQQRFLEMLEELKMSGDGL